MQTTDHLDAVLLLTTHLGAGANEIAKPLSVSEWARFATWLKDRGLEPASLLSSGAAEVLTSWVDKSINVERIERLLARSAALGLARERWERAGLWIVTRADPDYPECLKRHLGQHSPAALFGVGSKALMNSWGIAVVGSRDASDEDNSFAQAIGQDAASQGIILISGGARGIDRSAMLGALAAEGVAVGVLADNLLRFATSSMYRKHLADNRLALISPYNPETDFRTANAMERNKYIYCLSQAAIVVSSSLGTGGTWAGALENIKRGWVPLWVRASTDPSSGNNEIIKRGGLALSERPMLLRLLAPPQGDPAESHILPSNAPKSEAGLPNQLSESYASPYMPEIENKSSLGSLFSGSDTGKQLSGQLFDKKTDIERSLFETFLDKLAALTKDKPLSAAEVAAELDMIKAQASAWLKRALEKQLVKKSGRPSRYQVISGQSPQPSLFDTR